MDYNETINILRSIKNETIADFNEQVNRKIRAYAKINDGEIVYDDEFIVFLINNDLLDNYVQSLNSDLATTKKYLDTTNQLFIEETDENFLKGIIKIKEQYQENIENIEDILREIASTIGEQTSLLSFQQIYYPQTEQYQKLNENFQFLFAKIDYLIVLGSFSIEETKLRIDRFIEILRNNIEVKQNIIFTSTGSIEEDVPRSVEGQIGYMKFYFKQKNNRLYREFFDEQDNVIQSGKRPRMLLVDQSKDTVGSAVLTNLEISKQIFRQTLGRSTDVKRSEEESKIVVITNDLYTPLTSYVYRKLFNTSLVVISVVVDPNFGQGINATKDAILKRLEIEYDAEVKVLTLQQDSMFGTGDFKKIVPERVEINADNLYTILMNLLTKVSRYRFDAQAILKRYANTIDLMIRKDLINNDVPIDLPTRPLGTVPEQQEDTPDRPTTGIRTLPGTFSNIKANIVNADTKLCSKCKFKNAISKCGGCKKVKYCSKECQKNDWNLHKHCCFKN